MFSNKMKFPLPMQFMDIHHIAFDLDGVLIDSMSVMKSAWCHAIGQVGLNLKFEIFAPHIGKPLRDILTILDVDTALHRKIECAFNDTSLRHVNKIKTYADAERAVYRAKAAGLFLSIVTSKNQERTNLLLNRLFVKNTFDVIVTPEDVSSGYGKPNPASLLLACLKIGVSAKNTVYVGDMDSDRQCARNARIQFIHAGWGYGGPTKAEEVGFDNIEDMVRTILDNY